MGASSSEWRRVRQVSAWRPMPRLTIAPTMLCDLHAILAAAQVAGAAEIAASRDLPWKFATRHRTLAEGLGDRQ